jgi:hypothetical protein
MDDNIYISPGTISEEEIESDGARDLNDQVDEATINGDFLVEQDVESLNTAEPIPHDSIPDELEREMLSEYQEDLAERDAEEDLYNGDDDSVATEESE